MKKFTSMVVIVVLLLTMTLTTAFAGTNESREIATADEMNQFVTEKADLLIEPTIKYSEEFQIPKGKDRVYQIGNPIQAINDKSNELEENIFLYPVLNGKQVVGVITVFRDGKDLTATYAIEFAKELQKVLKSSSNFQVIYDTELKTYRVEKRMVLKDKSQAVIGQLGYIETSSEGVYPTFMTIDLEPKMDMRALASYNYPSSHLVRLPHTYAPQPNGWCWAVSASSIIEYKKGYQVNPSTICDNEGIGYNAGGKPVNSSNELTRHGISNFYYEGSRPIDTHIVKKIYESKPFIGFFLAPVNGEFEGHAVGICGYNTSSSGMSLTMMDPNYTYYKTVVSSGTNYIFTYWMEKYGAYLTFTWVSTVELN